MSHVGRYLRSCRYEAQKTQQQVANHCGLKTLQYISNVERGLCQPSMATIGPWCEITGANKNTVFQKMMSDYRTRLREGLGL